MVRGDNILGGQYSLLHRLCLFLFCSLVDNVLDDMLVTAHHMGTELDDHNVRLGRMNKKAEKLDSHTVQMNHRMNKQLK